MKIGIICSPVPGHMNPMCALANALKEKNHEIVFFNVEDVRSFIEDTGNKFVTVGNNKFPKGSWSKFMLPMSKKSGLSVIFSTIALNKLLTKIYCEDIPAAAKKEGIDLFLVDQIQFAGAVIAEKVGVPFITIACALRLNTDPSPFYPPPFVPWYGKSVMYKILNYCAYKIYSLFTLPILNEANGFAKTHGLKKLKNIDESFSKVLEIYQLPIEFDFETKIDKTNRHYVGPYASKSMTISSFDFSKLDSRPLIYVSLGTLQNGVDKIFKNIISACGELNEFQVVVSLGKMQGSSLDFKDFTKILPINIILVSYAPQPELIARSNIVITHGGLNTVLDCLASAVPMLAIPITNDQPAIAARIIHSNTGIVLSPKRATIDNIKNAIIKLRDELQIRQNVLKMKDNIQRAGGIDKCVQLIIKAIEKPS